MSSYGRQDPREEPSCFQNILIPFVISSWNKGHCGHVVSISHSYFSINYSKHINGYLDRTGSQGFFPASASDALCDLEQVIPLPHRASVSVTVKCRAFGGDWP